MSDEDFVRPDPGNIVWNLLAWFCYVLGFIAFITEDADAAYLLGMGCFFLLQRKHTVNATRRADAE